MAFVFDGRLGNYRNTDTGQVTGRDDLLAIVSRDILATRRKMGELATQLNEEIITLTDFQRGMIAELKGSHIRAATLAAGGRDGLNNRILGGTGRRLRQEYDALKQFVLKIERGEQSDRQILARAKSYARSALVSFSNAELITKADNGAVTARRNLDPEAEHCPECPLYDTGGEFIPIEDVVPIGVRCTCRAGCKCRITYRFAPDFNPLQSRSLSQMVAESVTSI